MGFMQNQITEKQDGWQVETRDAGTCVIPGDVVSVPDWLVRGFPITADCPDGFFSAFCDVISDYVEGRDIISIEAIASVHFARLSAPGYLDCSDWTAHKTIKGAREYLRDI